MFMKCAFLCLWQFPASYAVAALCFLASFLGMLHSLVLCRRCGGEYR